MKYFFRYAFFSIAFIFFTACGGGSNDVIAKPQLPPSILQEIRILVIGQSISSNCNQKIYRPVNNVFQIGLGGEVKAAQDPFEWADCKNGSMWMPLGRKLIEENIAQKVVFMPIGLGSTRVSDWQAGGRAYNKLNTAIDLIKKNNINFDFVLWHQGTSDIGGDSVAYKNKLLSVIDYVNGKINVNRWLISIHSRCFGEYDRGMEASQIAVGNMNNLKIYLGANNNLLGDEYRFDRCHLTERGQESMATMWAESIKTVLKQEN